MATQDTPTRAGSADLAAPATDEPDGRARRRAVLDGAFAGGFATVVMTVFRAPISRSPPPTARFWAQHVGTGSPADHVGRGLLLHLLYGTAAGAVFGGLVGPRLAGSDADRERSASLLGVVHGAVLSGFGVVVLLDRLLGLDLDRDERFVFHVSHLVYGVALGTWFGSADETGPDRR
jgi:hypothetical protein